jgi:hypothetical protein
MPWWLARGAILRCDSKRRRGLTRGRDVVLLIGLFLLGLAQASCARVQSHYQLPQLAAADPSFLLTLEAYTSAAHAGNSVDVLLNGDQIFPAALEAIRSAAAPESRPTSCWTASGPS